MRLDLLQGALRAAPGVAQWRITETVERRYERYLTFLEVESERRTAATRWQVWLALEPVPSGQQASGQQASGQQPSGLQQGEAGFTIGSSEDSDALVERVRTALDAAAAAPNPVWLLPAPGEAGTATPPADPASGCDGGLLADPDAVLDALVAEFAAAVPEDVRPSTLELFATVSDRRLLNHRGLDLRDRSTLLYAEWVLLHRPARGEQVEEVEFFDRIEATRAVDLTLTARVVAAAACVRDGALATSPAAGLQPVLITGPYVAALLGWFATHSDAAMHVRKINALSEQQPVMSRRSGEPLDLWSDPAVPSLSAYAFDADGYAPQRQELICGDVLVGLHGAGRWMQRLGRAAHGSLGTLVMPAGATPLTALRRGTLEIVRFSEFHPRSDTGAFSGEIRLAYLHHADGTRSAITGGSVSGTLREALADSRACCELQTIEGFHGPQALRLESVMVTR